MIMSVKTDERSSGRGGTAADRAERLTRTIRDQSFPNVKPRDSATLILIDRAEAIPKVLLGRRHERHRFMPGKFVFPGGRIEPADRLMATAAALNAAPPRQADATRETAERREGGGFALGGGARDLRGDRADARRRARRRPMNVRRRHWQAFAKAGIVPGSQPDPFHRPRHHPAEAAAALRQPLLHRRCFRDRAPRRGLCRAGQGAGRTGLAADYARRASSICRASPRWCWRSLQDRIAAGMSYDHPVPLYRMLHKRFVREVL